MKVTDDGDLVLHQSDIGHFMTCPEQFRVENGIVPGGVFEKNVDLRVETDAATIGTVFHATVEHELTGNRFQRVSDAERWAKQHMGNLVFEYMTNGTEYRTESFGDDPTKALATLAKLVNRWFYSQERKYWLALVADHPGSIEVEWSFTVPFIENRTGRYPNILLAGTADILDTYNHRLVDWKTSSRDYQRWEKQRWGIQPTVYTYAAAQQGLLDRHQEGYQFDFVVWNHKANTDEPQKVTVWRDAGQHAWLVQMVSNMVDMIESELAVWPLRDDHALCGPKWCGNWSNCKGMYVQHPDWS